MRIERRLNYLGLPAQRYAIAAAMVSLFASIVIVCSYPRLSHTWDEPTHVAAGLEWLETDHYRFQTENPPLARIAVALLPYLRGVRVEKFSDDWTQVPIDEVFYGNGDYVEDVTWARLPNLAFFWLVLVETWALSGGRRSPRRAALATSLVATTPAVVAHAGFATTDLAFVAVFLGCVWCWKRFLAQPDMRRALWLGASLGLALSTKFSVIPFFPPVALAMLMIEWMSRGAPLPRGGFLWARMTTSALGVAALIVWASYGFHVGRLSDLPDTFGPYGSMPVDGIVGALRDVPLPAHEFIHGLLYLRAHGAAGHTAYLMGQSSGDGFWLFYPLALFFKTPPLTLLLLVLGIAAPLLRRGDREWTRAAGFGAGAAALLMVSALSPLNFGLRHVLVVYPLLIMAGVAIAVRTLETRGARRLLPLLAVILVGVQASALVRAFPNQIAYFNVFAGPDPGWVLSDADFDWGQDVIALERYFAKHPVARAYLLGNGSALWCRHKLPHLTPLPAAGEVNGVIVAFERPYRSSYRGPMLDVCGSPVSPQNMAAVDGDWLSWLQRRQPIARVGAAVRIYRVTDAEESPVRP